MELVPKTCSPIHKFRWNHENQSAEQLRLAARSAYHSCTKQNQQQPLFCFFFDAFNDFFEPVLSFFSFLSFLPEALALPGAAPATPAAPDVGCFMGEPGCCCCTCVDCSAVGCWTSACCPTSTCPGAGCPLSCAISSGVSWPPAANFAKISGETFIRAGAAAITGALTKPAC